MEWSSNESAIVAQLHSQGYQVWLACESKDLAAAAALADRAAAAGIIIKSRDSSRSHTEEEIRSYISTLKNKAFRELIPGGKQPQMKGRLVVQRDGVLQVSSPSTQPWLDTNLAMVRLAQSIYGGSVQVIYDFRWDASDAPSGAWHPDADDYALAIAEADAIRSDVIIDLPVSLQKALNAGDPQAWSLWKRVMPYLAFSSREPTEKVQPVASLGMIVDNTQTSYEPANLMARHNIPFEIVRPSDLTLAHLANWNSVVVFCSLNTPAVAMLRDFAAKGGIVVFVNSHDEFPWHSTQPVRWESHSATYSMGAGQIVELGEPVIDPESFARDLRRLIGRERSALSLWNSLTTLVTGYREEKHPGVTLSLVNYADQPDNVQVQVRGHVAKVRLESPETPCCVSLPFTERDGFTEFTIPSVRIAVRVHLDLDGESSTAQ